LNAVSEEDKKPDDTAAQPVAVIVRAMAEALCEVVAKDASYLKDVEWRDLERLIAVALGAIGFAVELTRSAKDGGKDIIVRCKIGAVSKVFYVEIKHWADSRPGLADVTSFVEVNARDATDGGLFLSTSGYTQEVHGRLVELSSERVQLGDHEKILSLCRYYVRKQGVWRSEMPLPDILFEKTLD
jgi:restriction system protein